MSFDLAFSRTVGIEGKYSNNPDDAGGETMFGITIATAREDGYTGPMKALPLERAKSIYKKRYWDVLKLDEIEALSRPIAHELFDSGVNCGVETAARWLQRALTALNRQGTDFPDIAVDGSIGPSTIEALKAFMKRRVMSGEIVIVRALNAQQLCHYLKSSEARVNNETFLFGWILNRVT